MKKVKEIKLKKGEAMVKITMPPNATPKEIKEHIKTWKSIIKTFAELTGESAKNMRYKIIKEPDQP